MAAILGSYRDAIAFRPERFNPVLVASGSHMKAVLTCLEPGQFIPVHHPGIDMLLIVLAMGIGATDLAAETADIVIMTNDLVKIPEAIRIARATVRIMWQNIAIAMLTVAGLLAGVATGSVHMATGMLVHEMSVLIVTLNAIRLLRA